MSNALRTKFDRGDAVVLPFPCTNHMQSDVYTASALLAAGIKADPEFFTHDRFGGLYNVKLLKHVRWHRYYLRDAIDAARNSIGKLTGLKKDDLDTYLTDLHDWMEGLLLAALGSELEYSKDDGVYYQLYPSHNRKCGHVFMVTFMRYIEESYIWVIHAFENYKKLAEQGIRPDPLAYLLSIQYYNAKGSPSLYFTGHQLMSKDYYKNLKFSRASGIHKLLKVNFSSEQMPTTVFLGEKNSSDERVPDTIQPWKAIQGVK